MKGTEAIDHVRDEMAKAKDGYTAYMGGLMTAWLRLHPDAELDGKKTLAGAFAALKATAKEKAKGGCYAMPPDEIFAGMMEYYGITTDDGDFGTCVQAMYGTAHEARKAPAERPVSLGLDLDELLGG